jgi:hypothetical protein
MRCGGGLPSCKTCELYNDECRYDKVPPLSRVMALAQRLQEAEETIANLRAQSSNSSCEDPGSEPSPSPRVANTESDDQVAIRFSNSSVTTSVLEPHVASATEIPAFQTTPLSIKEPMTFPRTPKGPLPSDLSMDENGDIQYYGPTSAVHEPPRVQTGTPTSQVPSAASDVSSRGEIQSKLKAHAQESKMWEDFALRNASLHTGIPRHIMAKLLNMHWTWVSPMFMYVYRPGA